MFDLPRAPIAGQVGVLVQTGSDLDRTLWSSVTELAAAKRGIQTFRIYRVTTSARPADARLLVRN
jgi:hypothetical protein